MGAYMLATKTKKNAHNEFINRLFQLIADIPTCILYFLSNTYQNIHTALRQPKARHLFIYNDAPGQPNDVNAAFKK
jgi:hypothetical protein